MKKSKSKEEKEEEVEEMPETKEINGRKMWKIKCSNCGKTAYVPFRPTPGRDVLCPECFQKRRRFRRF